MTEDLPSQSKLEYLLVIVTIFLIWFSLFGFSGTLSSGYHFVDDHEIVEFNRDFSILRMDLLDVYKNMIIKDLTYRFRPLFYLHKILQTKLFATNFFLWSIYTGLLAVLTSSFLYLFARKLAFSLPESLCFAMLPLLGKQAEIWWRLGTSETLGTFLMSLALLFMAISIYSQRKLLYEFLFLISTVMMSFSKESFILLIPAILFWKLWLHKDSNNSNWADAIKANKITILFLVTIFLLEISIIKLLIGTSKVAYIHQEGFHPFRYYKSAARLAKIGGVGLLFFEAVILVIFIFRKTSINVFLSNFLYPLTLLLLIIIPQSFLYAKSGFYARFILPGLTGFFVFLIYSLRFIRLTGRDLSLISSMQQNSRFNSALALLGFLTASISVPFLLPGLSASNLFSFTQPPNTSLLTITINFLTNHPFYIFVVFLAGLNFLILSFLFKKGSWARFSLILMYSFILFYTFTNFGTAIARATKFTREGKTTTSFLTSMISKTRKADLILIVVDPVLQYEYGGSIKIYLNNVADRYNLYCYKVLTKNEYPDFKKHLIDKFDRYYGMNKLENINDKDSINCIAMFPGIEDFFLKSSKEWFTSSDFLRSTFNGFVLYYRPGK